jgi:hypothetical protein
MGEASRSAFIVANDDYADRRLSRLRAPAADARELANVLGDPDIGGFDVDVSLNEPEHVVRRRLSAFFDNRVAADVLLLHLSCHGVKDEDGRLYFATPDTEMDHLDATSIPSEFVNRLMTRSRSRRVLLLLDCCYSGAFARGWMSRAGDGVDIRERFDGRGRIVLTASSAMEYSFEGDELSGEGRPSVFTSALVQGLSTGEADRNRDGYISVDELYDFAYDQVRAATPSQTPGKWVFDVQGDFYVARSRLDPVPTDAGLPAELLAATQSPFAHIRAGAVEELAGLLYGPDKVMATQAREQLAALEDDDSQRVARAAARALGRDDALDSPDRVGLASVQVEAVDDRPTLPRAVVGAGLPHTLVEPAAPMRMAVFGRMAALALLAVLAMTASAFAAENPDDGWNLFAVFSPIEALGAAIAIWLVVGALGGARIPTSVGAGVLTVIGALCSVGSLGLLKFSAQRIDAAAVVLGIVVLLGSAVTLASGVACIRRSIRTASPGRIDPGALILALAGAGLAFVALLQHYDGFSSLASEVGEGTSAEFFFEPALAVVLVLVGLFALGWWPGFGAGALIATGAQTTVHYLGVLVAAHFAVGEVGETGPAWFIGLFGGLLVAAAGLYAQATARAIGSEKDSAGYQS